MEYPILRTEAINAWYGDNQVLRDVTLHVYEKRLTAIMGPSGCGKSTLIRCLNRMHELTPHARVENRVYLREQELYTLEPNRVRRMIGMVFQRPNPFPTLSIYDNVLAGYRLNGLRLKRSDADVLVEESLRNAALWDEVKTQLHRKGTFLSGGQQQRLCIARALAMKPEVLLLDEPTSALDPKATASIEALMEGLKKTVTICLVTHNIAQASRVSDYTAFMYLGDLVEFGSTETLFTVPKDKRTEEYLMGKFG
ncbi:MAG: phosphate ABC transporter ATP-binding protein [Acidobacteria bacterium]|nr:phosphate ABC transporter ATP-binding protein [Acidobacteriota bacterium]